MGHGKEWREIKEKGRKKDEIFKGPGRLELQDGGNGEETQREKMTRRYKKEGIKQKVDLPQNRNETGQERGELGFRIEVVRGVRTGGGGREERLRVAGRSAVGAELSDGNGHLLSSARDYFVGHKGVRTSLYMIQIRPRNRLKRSLHFCLRVLDIIF